MSFFDGIKNFGKKIKVEPPKDTLDLTKNWFSDRYEALQIQRTFLLLTLIIFSIVIVILTISITYIKSTSDIQPFVIEIEQKTGVPTVVDPIGSIIYSADEVVKRFFVWEYVKLREEYLQGYFDASQKKLSVMSSGDVYGQYKSIIRNPDGIVTKLAKSNGSIEIQLKSLVFINESTAQIRFKQSIIGGGNEGVSNMNKIVYMEFTFSNIEMNDEQRYLNPLGFRVTKYRIEDEKV
jgi:type IV secretion system protein VirB8